MSHTEPSNPVEVSLHPEPIPDPAVMVWHVAPGPVKGTLDSDAGDPLPYALARLVADGILVRVQARPRLVTTTIADGKTWAVHGPAVRSALHADLSDLAAGTAWPESSTGTSSGGGVPVDDREVAAQVRHLLDGPVGAVAASHGGSISLISVRDGVVTVELHGACQGCPAAAHTLGRRIESELRRHHPGVKEVRQAEAGVQARGAVRSNRLLQLWAR